MIKVYGTVQDKLLEFVEECLYEIAPHNWILSYNHLNKVTKLEGYFNSKTDADVEIRKLCEITKFNFFSSLSLTDISDEGLEKFLQKTFQAMED
jgi:hypothetical protein